jgi:ribonuclease HI
MIGAAAVLYRNGRVKRRLRMQLGLDKEHTVAEGEGVGMILGLELMRKECTVQRASMAVDNTSAILRANSTEAMGAQWIWDLFHDRWKMVRRQHRALRMTIRWVPGHEGVRGNEEADRLVKKAIEKGSSRKAELPAPLRE